MYRASELSDLIRRARIDAEMTQRELADAVGTTQSAIQRHERGDGISREALNAYARVLHLRMEDIHRALYMPEPESKPGRAAQA